MSSEKGTIDVSLEGIIEGYTSQDETKASAQNVVRIMWSGDETVYVYDGAEYLGYLTASIEGTDGTYAKLSGTITAPSGTKPVTLVYSPQFTDAPAVSDNKISLDLSVQDSAEVPFLIYGMSSGISAGTINDTVVSFSLATSVYKCNCTGLNGSGSISKAVIKEVNTCCNLTLSDSEAPVVEGAAPGSITRSAGFTAADERAIFSVALAKTDAGSSRSITIEKEGFAQTASFANTSFGIAKSYNAVFAFERLPEHILPGTFTIGSGKQVYFTKGNLFWDEDSFEFETNQYDFPTRWDPSHVGHFFWSMDVRVVFAAEYEEAKSAYSFSEAVTDMLFTESFSVGGINDIYHALSSYKWEYLLESREEASQKVGVATVCGITGLILLPDSFVDPKTNTDSGDFVPHPDNYNGNIYTIGDSWNAMESAGAVFLPEAGRRFKTKIYLDGYGEYLTSTCFPTTPSLNYILYFHKFALKPFDYYTRDNAGSVRLVIDVN